MEEYVEKHSAQQQLHYPSNSTAILLIRVHPELLKSDALTEAAGDEETYWRQRCRSIINLERHLHVNGTRIVNFFLHLSKEEQRNRFLARIDDPEKNWKFSADDITERGFWKAYMKAYEACLGATSTKEAHGTSFQLITRTTPV